LLDKNLSRNEMARQFAWYKNTIIAYGLDRLPDVDYLHALSTATNSDFSELIKMRLKAGLLHKRAWRTGP